MAVRDRIENYCERFAMTHLLASRTRLPGHEPGALERSLEHLAALHESLGQWERARGRSRVGGTVVTALSRRPDLCVHIAPTGGRKGTMNATGLEGSMP